MARILKYLLLLTILLAPLATMAQEGGNRILLRTEVTIDRPVIRLSDVFEGIDVSEDAEIALAPEPGQSVTYDANVLTRLAQRHSLSWVPESYGDKSILTRAAVYITPDMIRDVILKKIKLAGHNGGKVDVKFDGRTPGLTLPASGGTDFMLSAFSYDQQSRRFRAQLVTRNHLAPKTQFLAGHVVVKRRVPVLARRLPAGTIIGDSDIRFEEMDEARLAPDAITDITQIVGQELRRPQNEGMRFRVSDVMVPRMIKRGDIVTLRIVTPFMQISTKGRALQDGAYGEAVRVTNTRSKKVIEGTVIESGVVRVGDVAHKMASAN